jgi:predicted Zn-dependent protease
MFVHTGLIKAADSGGQVAGVLAHEMSHVALRHGVSPMGRASAEASRACTADELRGRMWADSYEESSNLRYRCIRITVKISKFL